MSLSGTLLIVLAVVTYRVTRFVVGDTLIDVPRDKFKAWVWLDPEEMRHPRKIVGHPVLTSLRTKLGQLLTCAFCVSVWIAAAAYVVVKVDQGWSGTSVVEHLVAWVAIAGGAVMIWNKVEIDVTEPEHIVLEEE